MEHMGFEPTISSLESLQIKDFYTSCCISCCIASKCLLIMPLCFSYSAPMVFLYMDFITESDDHPPRAMMYWSGTPIACIMLAA